MQGDGIPYQRLPIYGAFYWALLFSVLGLLALVIWARVTSRTCPQCNSVENADSLHCANCGFPNPRHLGTCENCGDEMEGKS